MLKRKQKHLHWISRLLPLWIIMFTIFFYICLYCMDNTFKHSKVIRSYYCILLKVENLSSLIAKRTQNGFQHTDSQNSVKNNSIITVKCICCTDIDFIRCIIIAKSCLCIYVILHQFLFVYFLRFWNHQKRKPSTSMVEWTLGDRSHPRGDR